MLGNIFSVITLGLIFKHLQSKGKSFSKNDRIERLVLIILSMGFSILYFICGIESILKGISIISLFKMEYGLLFIYATYKLYVLNKEVTYQMATNTSEHWTYSENVDKDVDALIKNTMICLEDGDFEKACLLIGKVDALNAVDQNIVLLKNIINQSRVKNESDYSQSFCY